MAVPIDVVIPEELEFILRDHKNLLMDVKYIDFLNKSFLKKYTKFNSFYEFLDFCPYTSEELKNDGDLYQSDRMNRYVYLTTGFHSFNEFFSFAVSTQLSEYVEKK